MASPASRVYQLEARVVALEREGRAKDDQCRKLERQQCEVDLTSADREMLTKERAEEVLQSAKEKAEKIKAITFGTKSFGKEAAEVAAAVVGKMIGLLYADLSDIIAGRPEAEALEVLQLICGSLPTKTLRELDLSENALGEKGIRALEKVLQSLASLEQIAFQNNGLSELSIELLVDCLPTENLKVLTFHNNMSGSGGAKAAAKIIAKSPKLEDFRMSSSRVRSDGGLPMIEALCSMGAGLTKVNLSDSMFDESCTSRLVTGLSSMGNLTDLILRDTGIDKDALLEALGDSSVVPHLSVLDISGLEIDEDVAEQVGKLASERLCLSKLLMDDNELGSEGAVLFCEAATNEERPSMLQVISIQTNQIGRRGALALAKFAVAHPSVERIELDDNAIAVNGVERVRRLLAAAQRPHVLGALDENAPSDDEDEEDEDEGDDVQDPDELDDLTAAMGRIGTN